ncbi:HAD family hydrolase [Streptomyces sp. MST-110588]|uniref:HAD family hydrolase n=1 Tax=Streptomyces sp. MST-110588 TaxID=2833628 RepID=UPI001F5C553E|nr:HAD family hydrolase [Streptomyces sp. MST-110588]
MDAGTQDAGAEGGTDVVLFDMFGVIARHQSHEGREALTERAGAPAAAFWEAYWALRPPYDRGAVTAEAYWRAVATALDTSYDQRRIADLIAADVVSWSAVDDAMVALVGELHASGRRIALLSNIPEELAAHYERHHRWLERFEIRGFSCRIGHVKPQPAAYEWCCRALGVAADRVLFVETGRRTSGPPRPWACAATCSPGRPRCGRLSPGRAPPPRGRSPAREGNPVRGWRAPAGHGCPPVMGARPACGPACTDARPARPYAHAHRPRRSEVADRWLYEYGAHREREES